MAKNIEKKQPTLGVLIQTYNESNTIDECIRSARRLSDIILVVDTESTDDTCKKVAKHKDIKLITFPYNRYVEPARQSGIEALSTDWIFILDADERVSQTYADEVHTAIRSDVYSHYKTPRLNYFKKTVPLRHGGWYPDTIIRLIKKEAFIKWPAEVHSTPAITGISGILQEPLIHFSQDDLGLMVQKTTLFEDIESNLLVRAGRKSDTLVFFRKFLGELYRRLIKNSGYRDGLFGTITSLYQAFSKTITYLYVYEKKQKSLSH